MNINDMFCVHVLTIHPPLEAIPFFFFSCGATSRKVATGVSCTVDLMIKRENLKNTSL